MGQIALSGKHPNLRDAVGFLDDLVVEPAQTLTGAGGDPHHPAPKSASSDSQATGSAVAMIGAGGGIGCRGTATVVKTAAAS